jgi:arylsulfatase A-like enzyme
VRHCGSCLLALLLAAAGGAAAVKTAAAMTAKRRPNVILVMADDMGWAQTGYYGHPLVKTPNLDDMASSGLRMDRFYSGAPSCTPTRATVMTGRTNDRTGAARVGDSINKVHDGVSLVGVFSAEPARRTQPLGFRASGGTMWLHNDWKLVSNSGKEDGDRPYELFNIIGDPGEQQNLIDLFPDIAARMRRQLDAWSASVDRSMTGADYPEGRVLPSGREPESS